MILFGYKYRYIKKKNIYIKNRNIYIYIIILSIS